jgi:hypothetical protein
LLEDNHRGAIVEILLLTLQQANERKNRPKRPYATRFSSLTSTSLQDVQEMTVKGGSPSGRGTVRSSFMMPPQEGQRRIARLSAKIMIAHPNSERVAN